MFRKNKKLSCLSVLILSLSFISSVQAQETYHIIREAPQIMPVNFLDDEGNPTGFETELLAEITKRAGIDVNEEFSPSFSSTLEAVKNKEKDIAMSSISITDSRKEIYEFSRPYFIGHVAIISKDQNIKTVADLVDKKVGVLGGSTHEEIIRTVKGENADDGSIITYDSSFLSVKATLRGDTDASIGDDVDMLGYVERYNDYGLQSTIDQTYGGDPYGIAIKKGATDLKEKIDSAINEIIEDGTYEEIFKRWYPNAELPDFD